MSQQSIVVKGMRRAFGVKTLCTPRNFWVLAAQRMSQAALVEAPRKAAAQQIQTRAMAEIPGLG
jgi:hypothetical protein